MHHGFLQQLFRKWTSYALTSRWTFGFFVEHPGHVMAFHCASSVGSGKTFGRGHCAYAISLAAVHQADLFLIANGGKLTIAAFRSLAFWIFSARHVQLSYRHDLHQRVLEADR